MKINVAHLNKRISHMASSYDVELRNSSEEYMTIWRKLTPMENDTGARDVVRNEYIYDEYEPNK